MNYTNKELKKVKQFLKEQFKIVSSSIRELCFEDKYNKIFAIFTCTCILISVILILFGVVKIKIIKKNIKQKITNTSVTNEIYIEYQPKLWR